MLRELEDTKKGRSAASAKLVLVPHFLALRGQLTAFWTEMAAFTADNPREGVL
ncbi:MAG: hypothetical protein KKI09_03100 [Spirochaetes bacterium]|nr:hypothetical protein [Spirochaetota bacterium]MBU0954393.1 hypothetical protein [Spirochaetota bacterium]